MSKEEILDQYRDDSKFPNINEVVFKQMDVIEAMSEYASQCTAPLEARIRELEEGLRELVEIGRKDHSNPKYDAYYNNANELLSSSSSDGWIDCKERLPDMNNNGWSNERVLAFDGHVMKVVSLYKSGVSYNGILGYNTQQADYMNNITHWRKLPKPPKSI